MDHTIITRTIGIDFIYLDLAFLIVWICTLIVKKHYISIFWGVFGFITYFGVEYLVWYKRLGVRTYNGSIDTLLFFVWLAFSPGFAQFSFVSAMFERKKKNDPLFWTLLFFIGWLLVALGSQLISLNNETIEISRNMGESNQRIFFIWMLVINITWGCIWVYFNKLTVKELLYIFLVGTLVELNLEFSLAISNIRQQQGLWSWKQFISNTLLEFNMGIFINYLLWSRCYSNFTKSNLFNQEKKEND
ncbi:MAG: hypothetical protein OEZ01_10450 [Candidatus Heimdallarchaeota archaeon]|nr:hypothetical protein [Candidatus Heimdallarchaeota archaeon]MDH5646420.1 hypothetical protein [Candidatus Heimdallarchaeota archaeon]